MTPDQLLDLKLHKDGSTLREMFEYNISDGFFWDKGEPPDGTEAQDKLLTEIAQLIINAVKEPI